MVEREDRKEPEEQFPRSIAIGVLQEDVENFMLGCGQVSLGKPTSLPEDVSDKIVELRRKLHREEWIELDEALENRDLEGIVDGIIDLTYVVLGTANAFGLYLPPFWEEVQSCNMKKLEGPKRADGKQLKPPGWKPPRIKELLEEQM